MVEAKDKLSTINLFSVTVAKAFRHHAALYYLEESINIMSHNILKLLPHGK